MTNPRITLYSFPPSQNAVRTKIALHEKGLAFEDVPLDLFAGEHKQPPFAELSPRQQVPTLVYETDGEPIVVYESLATIRFLDDMHPEPSLMPPVSEPRARADALMRLEEFQAKLDPKNIFGSVVFRRLGREALADRIDALLAELPHWERYLAGREYLAGDRFTLADIAVFPLLMHFEVLGYDYASRAPALHAYMDRMKARPSVRATGWVDLFIGVVAAREPE
ncbi:MAG: glutathione S-transferase family protein, partial [Myxococcales bacterium]|nr:glutathione S-transferase family protein [Myxococcales bacterium]